jgi:transposase-like protein
VSTIDASGHIRSLPIQNPFQRQDGQKVTLTTNNPLERLMREILRRTRVIGAFPDGNSALILVAARLRHVASPRWGTKRYLQMNRLAEVIAIA